MTYRVMREIARRGATSVSDIAVGLKPGERIVAVYPISIIPRDNRGRSADLLGFDVSLEILIESSGGDEQEPAR